MSKTCRVCNNSKDESNFYRTKSTSYPDSHLNWCKECIKDYRRKKRESKHKDDIDTSFIRIERGEFIITFD